MNDEHIVKQLINRRRFLNGALLVGSGAVLNRFGGGTGRLSRFVNAATGIPAIASNGERPFNMLVLGDSYAWQPGLRMSEKSCSIVRQRCVAALQGQRDVAPLRIFARSGAVIGELDYPAETLAKDNAAPWPGQVPDAFWDDPHPGGDVNYAAPCIWRQLARAKDPKGPGYVDTQLVDLVLVSGGGNDVAVTNIVAPRAGPNHHAKFRQWIDTLCGDRMKRVLPAIADAFPNARIVVTGYPQVVSDRTDGMELAKYLGALGVTAGGALVSPGAILSAIALLPLATPVVKEASTEQSAVFAEESSKVLQEAVDQVNAAHGSRRAVFADVRPFWGPINAYAAPESYFWHFTAPDHPPDNTADERLAMCTTHSGQVAGVLLDVICVHGAMGHPNVDGAMAYAAAIDAALCTFADWSSWCVAPTMRLTVAVTGETKDRKTILVQATDARTGKSITDAVVAIYGASGKTGAPLTYLKNRECPKITGEDEHEPGAAGSHGSRTPAPATQCAGTVTKPGYRTATFTIKN